jgi:shikimate dehydrogenase
MPPVEVVFGLVGRRLSHSFSRDYFDRKFKALQLPFEYRNFELAEISALPEIIRSEPRLRGLNVTVPYKESVISFLDDLSEDAQQIGAVNCIRISGDGLTGFNTDWIGFTQMIRPRLQPNHTKALVLGTGGSARAIAYAFRNIGIDVLFVTSSDNQSAGTAIRYAEIDEKLMNEHLIVVNCTPLGMGSDADKSPLLPFRFLSAKHLAIDLIYNPPQTLFLKRSAESGAVTLNGQKMLEIQADRSWEIWNATI